MVRLFCLYLSVRQYVAGAVRRCERDGPGELVVDARHSFEKRLWVTLEVPGADRQRENIQAITTAVVDRDHHRKLEDEVVSTGDADVDLQVIRCWHGDADSHWLQQRT